MRKICRNGYWNMQVCKDDGTVRPCGWTLVNDLGKLSEHSMKEILHGKVAEDFWESLMDGTFRYCNHDACPYLANGTIKEAEVEYKGLPDYPEWISLSYDHTCNYACTVCRKGDTIPYGKTTNKDFEKIEYEISKFINKVPHISANGLGEVFTSPTILDILSKWEPESDNPSVTIETNGALFDEEHWEKISNLGKYHLTVAVTVMSFDDATYKFCSGVKYDTKRIIKNLDFMYKLRQKEIINSWSIATVVQERNFRTLPEFTRKCLEYNPDQVRLRPFFPNGEWSAEPEIEWFYDIRNELHPYHSEYVEIMKDPVFDDPRVFHWSGRGRHMVIAPGVKNRNRYEIMNAILEDENFAKKAKEYLWDKGYSCAYIYGIAGIGMLVTWFLVKENVSVNAIIDEYSLKKDYLGIPVKRLDDESLDRDAVVIVNIVDGYQEVECNLLAKGFSNVISISELNRILKKK